MICWYSPKWHTIDESSGRTDICWWSWSPALTLNVVIKRQSSLVGDESLFLFSLNGAAAPLFLSQWCGCTFLFSRVLLMWGSPLLALEWCGCTFFFLWILTLLWRLSSPSSWFIHPLYGKSSFHVTLAIPFILNLMLSKPPPCTFPQNHPHSSIIYIHLSCPESTLPKSMWSISMSVFCTFPLTPPTWKKTTHQLGESQQASMCCWVTFPKIFFILKDVFQLHFPQVSSCQIKNKNKNNQKKKVRIHEVETIPVIQNQHSFH